MIWNAFWGGHRLEWNRSSFDDATLSFTNAGNILTTGLRHKLTSIHHVSLSLPKLIFLQLTCRPFYKWHHPLLEVLRECDVQNVTIHFSPLQNCSFGQCTVDGGINYGHTEGWISVASSKVWKKLFRHRHIVDKHCVELIYATWLVQLRKCVRLFQWGHINWKEWW